MKNKIIILFVSFLTIGMWSCEEYEPYMGYQPPNNDTIANPTDDVDVIGSIEDLNDYFKQRYISKDTLYLTEAEPEHYSRTGFLKFSLFAGNGGTLPVDSLMLIYEEYPTPKEMFYGQVQTITNLSATSNGKTLLATGGAFWWDVLDKEGQPISPSLVQVEMGIETDVEDFYPDLQYFKGSEENVNDIATVEWFIPDSNAQYELIENIFKFINIDRNWVNCDALITDDGVLTQFTGLQNAPDDTIIAESVAWLFVDDFPSVVMLPTSADGNFTTNNMNIPLGLEGTIVGISFDDEGKLLFGSQDISVGGDDIFEIAIENGTNAELNTLINQITQ